MAIAGHFWIEGTEVAYIDASQAKRTLEGTKDGATGKTAGHIWIEENKFRYIDSSGDERYIEGTLGGAGGTTFQLCPPRGWWTSDWNLSYSTIHNLDSADWYDSTALSQNVYVGQYHLAVNDKFLIYRAMISVDLSSLSPSLSIVHAKLVCPYIFRRSNRQDVYLVLVDATGVTGNDAGYGAMRTKTTELASLLIPQGTAGYDSEEIIFNSTGKTFLESKAGGMAQIGVRIDKEISATPPHSVESEQQDAFFPAIANGQEEAYLVISSTDTMGYIWIEETKFRYIDSSGNERCFEGTI